LLSLDAIWPWLVIAGLGFFHGLNPAMGWLFAVALGLHRHSSRIVLVSLIPIATGHAAAILLAVVVVLALGAVVELSVVGRIFGFVLLAWAAWDYFGGHRHRVRIGLQTGLFGLGIWSFLMASAHGAGLMLVPALLPLQHAHMHDHAHMAVASLGLALIATGVHTAAMLLATGVAALAVYHWLGVAVLKRGWINFDLLWALMLAATGIWLLVAPFA
jgi:hypothetical protein